MNPYDPRGYQPLKLVPTPTIEELLVRSAALKEVLEQPKELTLRTLPDDPPVVKGVYRESFTQGHLILMAITTVFIVVFSIEVGWINAM